MRRIYLGTTEAFTAAHRFYEKNGFHRVERAALPQSFPVMAVDTRYYQLRYARTLHRPAQGESASFSAARASNRVESSVGSGELASFMTSGISVQPMTTASQPASLISR